jgi:hypothetical protein
MKTSELIKLLQAHDPDSNVCIALCHPETDEMFSIDIGCGDKMVDEFASNDIYIAINETEIM